MLRRLTRSSYCATFARVAPSPLDCMKPVFCGERVVVVAARLRDFSPGSLPASAAGGARADAVTLRRSVASERCASSRHVLGARIASGDACARCVASECSRQTRPCRCARLLQRCLSGAQTRARAHRRRTAICWRPRRAASRRRGADHPVGWENRLLREPSLDTGLQTSPVSSPGWKSQATSELASNDAKFVPT